MMDEKMALELINEDCANIQVTSEEIQAKAGLILKAKEDKPDQYMLAIASAMDALSDLDRRIADWPTEVHYSFDRLQDAIYGAGKPIGIVKGFVRAAQQDGPDFLIDDFTTQLRHPNDRAVTLVALARKEAE